MKLSKLIDWLFAIFMTASLVSSSLLLMTFAVSQFPGLLGWVVGILAFFAPVVPLVFMVMGFMRFGLIKERSSQP